MFVPQRNSIPSTLLPGSFLYFELRKDPGNEVVIPLGLTKMVAATS